MVGNNGVAGATKTPGQGSDSTPGGTPAPATPAAPGASQGSTGSGGKGTTFGNDTGDPGAPARDPDTGTIAPIELDLDGSGIGVTQLTSSNTFQAINTDGYGHRTAWAAAGDAVLFVDPNALGTIRDADQYAFTDWDPSAKTDMEALRNVFDTNHDGVLDAADAAFGQFKLMVTNADGTTSVETLDQAGVASIDLTETSVTRSFADGSSVDGQTIFTRADGSIGTVAAVTYAADADGYAVRTTTTVNADGSTTVDNRALNPDGSLNNETLSTTSADGATRTISYDDNGTGVFDRSQTVADTTGADGSRTEVVSDYDGQGQLRDKTSTTTSADGATITIARDTTGGLDADGGDVVDETETRQTLGDGSIADRTADVSANGTVIDSTTTLISADGLGRDVQVDLTGDGTYDAETVHRTTVNGDGSRTETITDRNHDGSQTSATTVLTSADAQTRTTSSDLDGDGTLDRAQVAQTIANGDGSVTTRITTTNGDGSQVLGISATTVSADGLSVTTRMDMDGDGTFDRTTEDDTFTNDRGGQSENVTATSADGTVLSEVLTARSTDGVSRDTTTYDGQGAVLASDEIGVGPQGVTEETISAYGRDGTLLSRTDKTTSADGLTTTTRTDNAGDGSFDRVMTDQTIENSDGAGGSAEIAGTRSADGTLLGRTRIDTSADGLTVTTSTDSTGARNPDGTGIFDRVTHDATSYAGDGSRNRTVTTTSADGTVLSTVSTDTSADRQSHTVTTDANGDGYATTVETVRTAPNGTTSDKVVDFNPDGSHVDGAVRTTSADGLSITTRIDASGTGTFNRITTDDTTIGDDGLRTETVTAMANDGTVVGRTVTAAQANGDLATVSTDTAGDGTFDHVTTSATSHNADGGTSVTATDLAPDGSVRDSTTTVTAGNGLSSEVDRDLDGDGAADRIAYMSMAYAANGDVTTSMTDAGKDGLIYDDSTTTVSGDGRTTTINANYDGSNFGSIDYSTAETRFVDDGGAQIDDMTVSDAAGHAVKETYASTSGNGLSKTVLTDLGGAGTFAISSTDDTVLNDDGSRTETMASSGSAGLNSRTVVTTAGNGLSKTVQADADGNGTVDTLTQDVTTINADGSRDEAYRQTNQDQSLRNSTTIHTSADGKHVTIGRVLGADGTQAETIDRGMDGTVTDVLTDTDGTGVALGGETVTTSANGLVKTATYRNGQGTTQDTQNDTRVLNADGSTTEQFSDVDADAGVTAVFRVTTSGNGLYKHTDARFNGFLADYSAEDDTTFDASGYTTNDAVVSNTDGSERDEHFSLVSPDGLATSSSLDEAGKGLFSLVSDDTKATDGSETRRTTVLHSDTGAQDRQDIVTISADGRTRTLVSARDGDPTARYTETTVENPDGTYSDKSQFVSGTLAPSWTQTRSQTLDTTGGQTVVIADYDGRGGLADQATTTVSGNGLLVQTLLDTTGDGTADQLRTDTTVIEADGSRQENVFSDLAPGATQTGPGTMAYGRSITTSADGLSVVTATDDDGNHRAEKSQSSARGIDGSLTDTVTFYDNTTGEKVDALASDGSTSAAVTKTTSADGLIVTSTTGDITSRKTYVASSNGSYGWTQNQNSLSPLYAAPSASHDVDVNGVDTWRSSYVPDAAGGVGANTTTTIQISVAKEQAAVAEANAIYQTVDNRPMNDAEQEALIQYIHGGILDQKALAGTLTTNDASTDLNFIQRAYENDFGHDASVTDTAAYLAELQIGDRSQTHAQLVVDIAEKAVDEQAGNGLLALLPNAPTARAGTVTLISPETAAATNTAQNDANFTNAIGKPSGNLTPGQISQFGTLVGDQTAASAPQVNFASASSSTSNQGTAVPGFFSPTSGAAAKAPKGGAAGPLVVNLLGGQVHTTDLLTSKVKFDDTASGTATTTAWITANEGFVVLDPQSVQITDGSSMVSTFAALARYDANGDGTLTAAEAAKAGISLWVDANGDGVDEKGDVESLTQAGIASIDIKDAVKTGSYDNGNVIAAQSTVAFANGTAGAIADVWLAYGNALSQGATYQFGDNVVVRAADGKASELLYGTGKTVDAGATGLSTVVDVGSNNTLQAGTGASVTLVGGTADHLVGGSGADTLLANGDNETVATGTGTNTVVAAGANVAVDASHGTATIALSGTKDSVTGATATTTVDVTKGSGATVAATGSKVTVEGGVGAEISGSGVAVTAAGGSALTLDASNSTLVSDAASTVTVNGSHDALTLDHGSTVTVTGTADAVAVNSGSVSVGAGASATVTGKNDSATQASGSSLTVTGQGSNVEVTGTGATTAVDHGTVVLDSGASDTLAGTGNQVIQTQNTTLTATGTGTNLVVSGTGNTTAVDHGTVVLDSGASDTLAGTGNQVTQTQNTALTATGTGTNLVVSGTGNTSTLSDAKVTVQDGASSQVTGNRDTITAGPTGLTGSLTGSNDQVTITGTGGKVSVVGSNDQVAIAGSGGQASVVGSNDQVTIAGTGGKVSLNGTNDAATLDGGTLTLADGASKTLTGSNDTVTLGANATLVVTGNVNHVTEAGDGGVLTMTGSGNVATATGKNDRMILTGSNASAVAHGDNATLTVSGNDGVIYMDGSHDAVTYGGTNELISAKDTSSVTVLDGSSATVDGNFNTVAIGANTSLILKGTGDALTATGANDTIALSSSAETVSASSGTITLSKQIGVSVTGNSDVVNVNDQDTLALSGNQDKVAIKGSGNNLTITGSGNTVTEAGSNNVVKIGSGVETVAAGSVSVAQAANGTLSLYGGLATSAVTMSTSSSSSSATIALGNSNTVTTAAVPAKVDGYSANGLQSWEEIFNTMSGALNETDRYQYNSSNKLMEIDRYNGSGTKTQADLYDPATSAELGSYLYASNGHVNEVVDMLHNHDWLSQSNGTYKDKISGATSKTQPTLR